MFFRQESDHDRDNFGDTLTDSRNGILREVLQVRHDNHELLGGQHAYELRKRLN